MLILVGLGNPGKEYAQHRHNIGFMALDALCDHYGFSPEKPRFQGLAREGMIGSDKILALKPQTYMNESGRSVGEAMRFFKLGPADIIVIYDELDLAFAKIKLKTGGGSAGHNGIKSIAAHIGPDFHRLRLGIDHPGERERVTGHVLGNFSKTERDHLPDLFYALNKAAPWLVVKDFPRFLTEAARYQIS